MTNRIVFVLPSFVGGGAERVMIRLANLCDRERFRSSVLALNGSGPLREEVANDVSVKILGQHRLRSALIPLARYLRFYAPDIVITTMGYLNFGVLLLRPFMNSKTRVLVREANAPDATIAGLGASLIGNVLYRSLYPQADTVICPSRMIAEELVERFGLDELKVCVLPNPIDERYIRRRGFMPIRHSGGGLRLIAAGRLTHQKGFDRLIEMASLLPSSTHIRILGEGEDRRALEAQRDRAGLTDRIEFIGYVESTAPYCAGADAFLLPSRWEGMPNAALEALAVGTPVIATPEAGGIMELAEMAAPGAVTIAASGAPFVAAMKGSVAAPSNDLRPSLLPKEFNVEHVYSQFETVLEDCLK